MTEKQAARLAEIRTSFLWCAKEGYSSNYPIEWAQEIEEMRLNSPFAALLVQLLRLDHIASMPWHYGVVLLSLIRTGTEL